MKRVTTVLWVILFQGTLVPFFACNAHNIYQTKGIKKKLLMHRAARFFGEIIVDAVMLNKSIFSMNSVKIATAFTSPYLAARMVDERLQQNFYDCDNHKNVKQLPKCCYDIARVGIGIPMVALSSLALFGWNEDLRMTGRIFAIGIPFVQSGKDLIKKLRFKACLRPLHESFSKEKRVSGGFPSGHMANVAYMTTLFGMRHGLAWGIPLGLFSTFVLVDFLNCNRHYLSQLIAGVGLGVIFGFAASKVIDQKLEARLSFDCIADSSGEVLLKCPILFEV